MTELHATSSKIQSLFHVINVKLTGSSERKFAHPGISLIQSVAR